MKKIIGYIFYLLSFLLGISVYGNRLHIIVMKIKRIDVKNEDIIKTHAI